MDIEIKSWLYDILNAVNEIESFFVNDRCSFEEYQSNVMMKRAVERNVEIIGEAVKRILDKNDAIQLSNARKIVDTRNRIIHGYESVSDETIWSIVITHIPILKAEVSAILGE